MILSPLTLACAVRLESTEVTLFKLKTTWLAPMASLETSDARLTSTEPVTPDSSSPSTALVLMTS